MKNFLALSAAALVAVSSTAVMAQCQSCQQNQVFAQPVYSAPVQSAPVQSAPVQSAPVYSAPIQAAPIYSAPVQSEVVYNAPMAYESAPVVSSGICGCGGGMVVDSGVSYDSQATLTVGSVINGETVVSVGESVVTSTTEDSQSVAADSETAIEGEVEPSSDEGEVVAPASEGEGEVTPPAPDEA